MRGIKKHHSCRLLVRYIVLSHILGTFKIDGKREK